MLRLSGKQRRTGAKALGQHAEIVQGIAGSPEGLERNVEWLDDPERRQQVGKGRPDSAGQLALFLVCNLKKL